MSEPQPPEGLQKQNEDREEQHHGDDHAEMASIEDDVRALRQDVVALRELLQTTTRPRTGARQVVATPEQERIARQLRDDLIRREEELSEARKELLRTQRSLDEAETRRRKLLESRTWKWGKTLSTIGTAPARSAKGLYSWLLAVLPAPANQALRRAVAKARGGRSVSVQPGKPRSGRGIPRGAAPTTRALVPIPVHGPEGVGAALTSPAVLVIGYGLDEPALEDVVEQVEALRREVDGGLRVLIVTDCDAFHIFRSRSLLFEYLPPRTEWEKHGFDQSYDDFRAARFQELFRIYAPERIVHVRSGDDLRGMPVTLFANA